MKRFVNIAAQGDMLIRRVAALPEDISGEEIPAEDGAHILAHSETGHHHVVLERPGVKHFKGMEILKSYLVIPEGDDPDELVELKHLREEHTHETLGFSAGVYEIIRQREADVTHGWRVAAD